MREDRFVAMWVDRAELDARPADAACTPEEDIVDLRSEQHRAARGAMAALVVCTASLAIGYTILPRWFHFPVDLPARLAFAVKADLFVLLWVVLGVVLVALGRGRSAADIGGAARSPPSPADRRPSRVPAEHAGAGGGRGWRPPRPSDPP